MTDINISGLLDGLKKASAEYQREPRMGSFLALSAVLDFLKSIDCEPELRQPLYELAGALGDAERGISNPLTTPAEHPGGAPKPIKEMLDKAVAAATVTLFMEAQRSLDEAINEVLGVAASVADKNALKQYRKNILGRRAPQPAVDLYWSTLGAARNSDLSVEERAARAASFVKVQ
jgi:hypothetical protein